MYNTDNSNHSVLVFTTAGEHVTTFGQCGSYCIMCDRCNDRFIQGLINSTKERVCNSYESVEMVKF